MAIRSSSALAWPRVAGDEVRHALDARPEACRRTAAPTAAHALGAGE